MKRSATDDKTLAAHQLYLNQLIPEVQEISKDWDLSICEGIMTCLVVYEGKVMLAGYSWESRRPGYSTRPMPRMYDKDGSFIGTVSGNMVKTGPIRQGSDPQYYPKP